jgi:hypothetical protein
VGTSRYWLSHRPARDPGSVELAQSWHMQMSPQQSGGTGRGTGTGWGGAEGSYGRLLRTVVSLTQVSRSSTSAPSPRRDIVGMEKLELRR